MLKTRVSRASDLTGSNIYHIKNQTIYYDVFSKNAYVITNDVTNTFSFYQMIILAALAVSCISGIILSNYIIGFGIGFVVYGILEILFHIFFLRKLPVNVSFAKPQTEPVTVHYAKLMPFYRIIIIIILALLSTLMMVLNAMLTMSNIFYFIVNILIALVCAVIFILAIMTAIRKKKDNL